MRNDFAAKEEIRRRLFVSLKSSLCKNATGYSLVEKKKKNLICEYHLVSKLRPTRLFITEKRFIRQEPMRKNILRLTARRFWLRGRTALPSRFSHWLLVLLPDWILPDWILCVGNLWFCHRLHSLPADRFWIRCISVRRAVRKWKRYRLLRENYFFMLKNNIPVQDLWVTIYFSTKPLRKAALSV